MPPLFKLRREIGQQAYMKPVMSDSEHAATLYTLEAHGPHVPFPEQQTQLANPIPSVDLSVWCEHCAPILSKWYRISRQVHITWYHSDTRLLQRWFQDAKTHNCLVITVWELVFLRAEAWWDDLQNRIESPAGLLPWSASRRLGPAIYGDANEMGITIGEQLRGDQLAELVSRLLNEPYSLPHPPSISTINKPFSAPLYERPAQLSFGDDMVGGVLISNDNLQLIARAGWMYDLATFSEDTYDEPISVLSNSDVLSICVGRNHPSSTGLPASVIMPLLDPDTPNWILRPRLHNNQAGSREFRVRLSSLNPRYSCHTSIHIDPSEDWGRDPGSEGNTQLSVACAGRIIETASRPSVVCGSRCPHRDLYGMMTHCSSRSIDLITKLPAADEGLPDPPNFFDEHKSLPWGYRRYRSQSREQLSNDLLARRKQHSELLTPLGSKHAPFERNATLLVRCGSNDGPPEPIVLLAAFFGKKVYIIHRQECWSCALFQMERLGCTVGIAKDTKNETRCGWCPTFS